jgi:hypothetical protein
MTPTGPRGWVAGTVSHRYLDSAATPLSYDGASHTVNAVLSTGAPVRRFFGTEVLRIDQDSIILDRVATGSCPLLDSHNQSTIASVLGRISSTWIRDGALWGRLAFAETRQGKIAEGIISRNEVAGISCGYKVETWEISDADGNIIPEDASQWRWDDTDLTFTAVRWQLLEASLCAVAADASASVRSLVIHGNNADVRARMLARQTISARQAMYDAQARVFGNSYD